MLMARRGKLVNFGVHEPSVNLSDHRPIYANVYMNKPTACHTAKTTSGDQARPTIVKPLQLRWDHGDLKLYYDLTGVHVQELLYEFNLNLERPFRDELFDTNLINDIYEKLILILTNCASLSVPHNYKGYYKFWWDQELDLKEESINSHNLWKLAGRPHNGPCFSKYRSDKLAYKLRIRRGQEEETTSYTNDLNDALMAKHGRMFWNCWRSKFGSKDQRITQVEGLTNEAEIADRFASHFQDNCSPLTVEGNKKLKDTYDNKRAGYQGTPLDSDIVFNAENIDSMLSSMKKGKAAGLDGLSVEHLQHCHPCVPTLLAKLFNLIMQVGKVPDSFGLS
jgi:hypothetical protein